MKSTAKAIALARGLNDNLSKRFANGAGLSTIRQQFDANGWPMLFISHAGNEAEGQPVVVIRISGIDAISTDILGNDLTAFSPHQLEVAYELNTNGAPTPAATDLLTAEYESIKTGVKIELKAIAHGTAVTEASMNAATPAITLDNLYWKNTGV